MTDWSVFYFQEVAVEVSHGGAGVVKANALVFEIFKRVMRVAEVDMAIS